MAENYQPDPPVSFVWIFNGDSGRFPSGVFTDEAAAEEWIERHKLTGTLTAYPLNNGLYDWVVERGDFIPKRDDQKDASFIGNFSSATLDHRHYEDGR